MKLYLLICTVLVCWVCSVHAGCDGKILDCPSSCPAGQCEKNGVCRVENCNRCDFICEEPMMGHIISYEEPPAAAELPPSASQTNTSAKPNITPDNASTKPNGQLKRPESQPPVHTPGLALFPFLHTLAQKLNLTSNSSQCPPGVIQFSCFTDPCRVKRCPARQVCERNYCGGCTASCKRKPVDVDAPSACPPGVPIVRCFSDPCKDKSCPTDQVCESNYCGGCNAVCKTPPLAPILVPSNSTTRAPSTTCPPGVATALCEYNPCIAALCPVNTTCEPNYCGGCNAECKPLHVEADDAQILKPGPSRDIPGDSPCPPDVAVARCFADPCLTHTCGTDEVCESNYCGGCNAVCKPKTAAPVRAAHGMKKCPEAVKEVQCKVNPCAFTTCPVNHSCEVNYCGDCTATCKPAECEANKAWNATANACSECGAGRIVVDGKCEPCPVDTYYLTHADDTACVKCPAGKSTKGAKGALKCVEA